MANSTADDERAAQHDVVTSRVMSAASSSDQILTSILTNCQTSQNDVSSSSSAHQSYHTPCSPDLHSCKQGSAEMAKADDTNTVKTNSAIKCPRHAKKGEEKDEKVPSYTLDSLINIVALENLARDKRRKSGHCESKDIKQKTKYCKGKKKNFIQDSQKITNSCNQNKTRSSAKKSFLLNYEPNQIKMHRFTNSAKIRSTKTVRSFKQDRDKIKAVATLDVKTISHQEESTPRKVISHHEETTPHKAISHQKETTPCETISHQEESTPCETISHQEESTPLKAISHHEETTRDNNKRDSDEFIETPNLRLNNMQDIIVANKTQSFRTNKVMTRPTHTLYKVSNSEKNVNKTNGLTNVEEMSKAAKKGVEKINKARNKEADVTISGRQRSNSHKEFTTTHSLVRLRSEMRLCEDTYQIYARVTPPPRLTYGHDTVGPKQNYVSVHERPYTRSELAEALPRRSFFSCHEKALREAGLLISARPKRAPSYPNITSSYPNSTSSYPNRSQSAHLRQVPAAIEDTSHSYLINNLNSNGANHSIVKEPLSFKTSLNTAATEETSSAVAVADVKPLVVTKEEDRLQTPEVAARKKNNYAEVTENSVANEPLFKYLEYVKGNQKEFLQYLQTIKLPADDKQNSFIKLGHAFDMRHHGGSVKISDGDIVVLAANLLRQRTFFQGKLERTKEPLSQTRAPAENGRKLPERGTAQAQKDDALAKTELEKRKLKAEEWARTVSTHTLSRTKQKTLKVLGSDYNDLDISWETLQNCQYLRNG